MRELLLFPNFNLKFEVSLPYLAPLLPFILAANSNLKSEIAPSGPNDPKISASTSGVAEAGGFGGRMLTVRGNPLLTSHADTEPSSCPHSLHPPQPNQPAVDVWRRFTQPNVQTPIGCNLVAILTPQGITA